MNILDVQNKLKNFSEEQLVQEMQAPTGNAPQFLVLSEIQRRKRMRDDLQQQQAQPVQTVAEEAIAAGGVPQGGIGQLAGAIGQGSSNAQMPQQQAPEQQPQGMYDGGIVKLAPGGAVGGMLSLRGAGDAKAIIVDENGNAITGPLPSAYAKTIMDKANAAKAARSEVPQSPAEGAEEPSFFDTIKGVFGFGDSGPSQTELMKQGASAPSAFANKNVRLGQPTDRGGIGAMLEATTQPAPQPTGVTPAGIAAINQSADVRRGVPLAALEQKMAKARMNITGPSVFDNPADVADLTAPQGQSGNSFNPDKGMEDILAQAQSFQEENFSNVPNYGPPGSKPKDEKSWADFFGYGALRDTPIAKTFAEFGNVPSIFDLEPKDTERRDPSGEPPKKTPPATTPNNVVQEPNSTADDPRSPGGFGAMSPYETELMNMLKSKEQQAEKDKWMSLAKAGLSMMSSKSPNFGVAFGESAMSALEDYQAQKSQYETDRLALLGGIEKSRLGREAAARAGQGKPNALSMNSLYTGLQKQLEIQEKIISDPLVDPAVREAAMREMNSIRARMSQIESTAGLTDFVAG